MAGRKIFLWLGAWFGLVLCAQAQQVDAILDLARFRMSDSTTILELYTTIQGQSVNFVKNKTAYQAAVAMEVEVRDSAGIRFADKVILNSPEVTDPETFKPAFSYQTRMLFPNGKYTLRCQMQDLNTKQPPRVVEVPLQLGFPKGQVQVSDVQLLESYTKTNEQSAYTRNGYKLISYVSGFYPKEIGRLKWYAEIYNTDKVAGTGEPVVLFYRIEPEDGRPMEVIGNFSKQKAAPVNVLLAELDIKTLPSGNYYLVIEVKDRKNTTLALQRKFIQRSNPSIEVAKAEMAGQDASNTFADALDSVKLKDYLLYMIPVANAAEVASLQTLANTGTVQQQRNYLYYFWRKRSEADAEKLWQDYLARIRFVEQEFSNKAFMGYQTDFGRVYLQHGPPNKVQTERNDPQRPINNSDSRPYQIWHYYKLQNQSNRIFVFMQQNLGNSSYRLIHSDAVGEINNPNWRREVNQRTGVNSNFDRNSGWRNE